MSTRKNAHPLALWLSTLLTLGCFPVLSAQDPGAVSAQVARVHEGLQAMGRTWNARVLAETARLYLPLHQQRETGSIRRTADITYGSHRQQTLDLFAPDQGFDEPGPVLVFVHDGDDKLLQETGGRVYSNVAMALARAGGVGISANYRTAAGARDGAEDIRRLVEWTRRNVSAYGGDPEAILVMGHGDGAVRLATYLFQQEAQPHGGPGIAGAILFSGRFDSPSFWKMLDAYQGPHVPLMLMSAELDAAESGIEELGNRLCGRMACPMRAALAGHNHVSPVLSFDTVDMSAMGQLHRFYHSVIRK